MHFYALELTSYFSLACTKLYFPFLTTINTYSKLKSILSNKVPYSITILFISLNNSLIDFIFSPKCLILSFLSNINYSIYSPSKSKLYIKFI